MRLRNINNKLRLKNINNKLRLKYINNKYGKVIAAKNFCRIEMFCLNSCDLVGKIYLSGKI